MDVTDTPARPQPTLPAPDQALIDQACDRACAAIAPAWPLDRSIAVNPHWGRVDRPVLEVAARMAVLGGIRVFPSRRQFRQAWQEARLTEADLQAAIDELGATRVDVNEQNPRALGFYLHEGFEVIGRSETDGLGQPYPLLHMRLMRTVP